MCPICEAQAIEIRGKLVCPFCHIILETCCEGGRCDYNKDQTEITKQTEADARHD